MIDVGEVTTWLCGYLGSTMLIGDGVAPLAGGWAEGAPNSGVFTPYVVVHSGPVSPTLTNTPLCSSQAGLLALSYRVVAYDVGRVEADALAAAARYQLKRATGHPQCGDMRVSAHQMFITGVSGATRDDSTNPKLWSATTNFTVNATRAP